MATYGYKAITKAGKEVKGSLEADNKDLAMAELRRQELTVIDLGEQSFLTKDIDIQIGVQRRPQTQLLGTTAGVVTVDVLAG